MLELSSDTLFATIDPPGDVLPPGAAVTLPLAKHLFDRQREAVCAAVALATRHIRAARSMDAVHAKAYGPRTLRSVIGEHNDERTGYGAGHAQGWPGGGKMVEGVVLVGWDGQVWIRWQGIAPPAD